MAFEYMDGTVISICANCVYFNAYGRYGAPKPDDGRKVDAR